MVAARAQCGQGWVVDGYGDCNAGLPRQLMVLGMWLVLDQGVPTNGCVVLGKCKCEAMQWVGLRQWMWGWMGLAWVEWVRTVLIEVECGRQVRIWTKVFLTGVQAEVNIMV